MAGFAGDVKKSGMLVCFSCDFVGFDDGFDFFLTFLSSLRMGVVGLS